MSVVGIWHSLHYGRIGCAHRDCPGIRKVFQQFCQLYRLFTGDAHTAVRRHSLLYSLLLQLVL